MVHFSTGTVYPIIIVKNGAKVGRNTTEFLVHYSTYTFGPRYTIPLGSNVTLHRLFDWCQQLVLVVKVFGWFLNHAI